MSNKFFPNYDKFLITSPFGVRTLNGKTTNHNGVDLVATNDGLHTFTDFVTAFCDGTVSDVGYDDTKGNYIKIKNYDNVEFIYLHLREKPSFDIGDYITTGRIIGYMGNTGNSYGAHLHFSIKTNGVYIDPTPWLENGYICGAEWFNLCRIGDKGLAVYVLQIALDKYYPYEYLQTDGYFGEHTKRVVERFQNEFNLNVDGVCGSQTWGTLLQKGFFTYRIS